MWQLCSTSSQICHSRTSFDDEDDIEDDEDSAWKVRKQSCRLMTAIIAMHPVFAAENFAHFAAALLPRFKEREENVRVDVFSTYAALLGLLTDLRDPLAGRYGQDTEQSALGTD